MTELFCFCRRPYNEDEFMIECTTCQGWFHGTCVNVTELEAENIDNFYCATCLKVNNKRIEYKQVKNGSKQFLETLLNRSFEKQPIVIRHADTGHKVTNAYMDIDAFLYPIVVKDKDGLQLEIPEKPFGWADVAECVGRDKEIDVINVDTQMDNKMKLGEFVDYCASDERKKTYNCISLEFSDTKLSEKVQVPHIVSEMSWVNNHWPSDLQDALDDGFARPEISKYCLMSCKGSYTDFHIDFAGTSVWYHVYKGQKVFFLIRPTIENVALYKEWLRMPDSQTTFFTDYLIKNRPDTLDSYTAKFVLEEGCTILMPSGWIHAVYTPEDSLVFGGNFLCNYHPLQQMKIYQMERSLKTPAKYMMPNFEVLLWYIMASFTKIIKSPDFAKDRSIITPVENLVLYHIYRFLLYSICKVSPFKIESKKYIPASLGHKQILKIIRKYLMEIYHDEDVVCPLDYVNSELEEKVFKDDSDPLTIARQIAFEAKKARVKSFGAVQQPKKRKKKNDDNKSAKNERNKLYKALNIKMK